MAPRSVDRPEAGRSCCPPRRLSDGPHHGPPAATARQPAASCKATSRCRAGPLARVPLAADPMSLSVLGTTKLLASFEPDLPAPQGGGRVEGARLPPRASAGPSMQPRPHLSAPLLAERRDLLSILETSYSDSANVTVGATPYCFCHSRATLTRRARRSALMAPTARPQRRRSASSAACCCLAGSLCSKSSRQTSRSSLPLHERSRARPGEYSSVNSSRSASGSDRSRMVVLPLPTPPTSSQMTNRSEKIPATKSRRASHSAPSSLPAPQTLPWVCQPPKATLGSSPASTQTTSWLRGSPLGAGTFTTRVQRSPPGSRSMAA